MAWVVVSGGVVSFCLGRWHQLFGIHSTRVSKVLAAVAGALGGRPDFEHGMIDYSKVKGAANSLSADVRASIAEYLLDRTRVDPEKKQVTRLAHSSRPLVSSTRLIHSSHPPVSVRMRLS